MITSHSLQENKHFKLYFIFCLVLFYVIVLFIMLFA